MTLPSEHRCRILSSVVDGAILRVTANIDGFFVTEEFDARSALLDYGEHHIVHHMSTKHCRCPVIKHFDVPERLKPIIPKLRHRVKRAIRILRGTHHEDFE